MQRPDSTTIPVTPGVYIYKDASGRILYVGKARHLRRRVMSYFRADVSRKTAAMLAHAVSLETLSTGTEKEALLLEASLIKRHRPHYNIVLRDDKQYVLFRLAKNEDFPRLEVVRQSRRDGARYFGPFTSGQAARETWKTIHRAFPLRRCADRAFKNRVRPCLYCHLGQCLGPCVNDVPREEYAALIHRVELLLSGRSRDLLRELREAMLAASDNLEFEKAAALRDQIRAVERTVERQSVVLPDGGDMDVVGIAPIKDGLGLGLLFVRDGKLVDGRSFSWPGLELEDGPELLWTFLTQYYGGLVQGFGGVSMPPRIIVPFQEREEDTGFRETLETALAEERQGPVRILLPRGPDEAKLVDMAASNAREAATSRRDAPMGRRLAVALQVPDTELHRIECVDVSHTGGQETRVGLVVFENGKPFRDAFRTYTLEHRPEDTASPTPLGDDSTQIAHGNDSTQIARGDDSTQIARGDDYAALAAWAKRRAAAALRQADPMPWPDLLLVDGGRGQLSAVLRGFRDVLRVDGLPFVVAGIAKARDEEGHADRRAGNVSDRIFLPGRSNPLPLRSGSAELLFLQHVRDTAHNYVIGRHRKAREHAALSSELLRVPGIGPSTEKLLWAHFSSLEAMLAASVDDLAALPGIGKRRAARLHEKLQTLRGE